MEERCSSASTSGHAYSPLWFRTFLQDVDPAITHREVAFVQRRMPPASHPRVLDLCCGPGRHLGLLAAAGYEATGLDIDALPLAGCRARGYDVVRGDMRCLPLRDGALDGVVCFWQSFGHFDDTTNRAVLADVARVLRPGGIVILDVYHRLYHERPRRDRTLELNGLRIVERRAMRGDRLRVSLRYEDASDGRQVGCDDFEWRLYTPRELTAEAHRVGLSEKLSCSEFDETSMAGPDIPRMQLVFLR
jgi:SAM-dependent methyltransferase